MLLRKTPSNIFHFLLLILIKSKGLLSYLAKESNEIVFYHSYGNTPLVKGCYGTPPQCFKLQLSTNYNQNWLIGGVNNNKYYNKLESSSYKADRLVSIREKGISGLNSFDFFSIENFILDQIEFALLEQVDVFEYTGVLSFGYLQEPNEYSILNSLYSTGQIQSLLFYVTYINPNEGRLIFGNYPKEKSGNQYKKCSLFKLKDNGKNNHRWECQLNAVYYEGSNSIHFIKTDMRISFNLSANLLLFPKHIFDEFVIKYFGDLVGKDKICHKSKRHVFTVIKCDKEFDYKQLGKVSYMIGKWSLSLKPSDLFFQTKNEEIDFAITKHETIDKFIFGNPMFIKFNTVFDKENNEIGIFTNSYPR